MFLYFASQAVHDPFADCTGNSAYEEGVPATYMDKKLYDQVGELLLRCSVNFFDFEVCHSDQDWRGGRQEAAVCHVVGSTGQRGGGTVPSPWRGEPTQQHIHHFRLWQRGVSLRRREKRSFERFQGNSVRRRYPGRCLHLQPVAAIEGGGKFIQRSHARVGLVSHHIGSRRSHFFRTEEGLRDGRSQSGSTLQNAFHLAIESFNSPLFRPLPCWQEMLLPISAPAWCTTYTPKWSTPSLSTGTFRRIHLLELETVGW